MSALGSKADIQLISCDVAHQSRQPILAVADGRRQKASRFQIPRLRFSDPRITVLLDHRKAVAPVARHETARTVGGVEQRAEALRLHLEEPVGIVEQLVSALS